MLYEVITDVILVGVSRSGKTPTSLYLAMQFGVKAANYPLIPEDFDRNKLPTELHKYRRKLFGLTRITSYNVCYTKLLRFEGEHTHALASGDFLLGTTFPLLGTEHGLLEADLPRLERCDRRGQHADFTHRRAGLAGAGAMPIIAEDAEPEHGHGDRGNGPQHHLGGEREPRRNGQDQSDENGADASYNFV